MKHGNNGSREECPGARLAAPAIDRLKVALEAVEACNANAIIDQGIRCAKFGVKFFRIAFLTRNSNCVFTKKTHKTLNKPMNTAPISLTTRSHISLISLIPIY